MRYQRQKKNNQHSHADDWLMTYADMITLLLCFFAVFLSVSIPKKDAQKKTDIPPPVEEVVKHPIPFVNLPLLPTLARVAMPPDEPGFIPAAAEHPAQIDQTITERQPEVAVASDPAPPVPTPVVEPEKPAASLPEIVDHLKTEGLADIQQRGDRLTTLDMNSGAFFAVGSATLSDAGKAVLHDVAANIKSDQFKDYQITVEGHTDDSPIKTLQFPSNWELSTARASAVVHYFLEQGIPAQRLRAAGYADTFPKAPNRDANGNPIPSNQAQNRRVVIKLEKVDKAG